MNLLKINSITGRPSEDGLSFFRMLKPIIIAFSFLCFGCGSAQLQSPSSQKIETPKASVCDSENYKDNPDYNPVSEKQFVNKIKDGEQVYLQKDVQKCETTFSEEDGLECGLQLSLKLVWELNKKIVDSISFVESGCEDPNSPSLRIEPWAPNDVRVRKNTIKVEHYWNYYSRSANEDEECKFRVFKIDRNKQKLQELREEHCQ